MGDERRSLLGSLEAVVGCAPSAPAPALPLLLIAPPSPGATPAPPLLTGLLGAVKDPVSVSSAAMASSVVSALLSSEASRDLLESPAVFANPQFPSFPIEPVAIRSGSRSIDGDAG